MGHHKEILNLKFSNYKLRILTLSVIREGSSCMTIYKVTTMIIYIIYNYRKLSFQLTSDQD